MPTDVRARKPFGVADQKGRSHAGGSKTSLLFWLSAAVVFFRCPGRQAELVWRHRRAITTVTGLFVDARLLERFELAPQE